MKLSEPGERERYIKREGGRQKRFHTAVGGLNVHKVEEAVSMSEFQHIEHDQIVGCYISLAFLTMRPLEGAQS